MSYFTHHFVRRMYIFLFILGCLVACLSFASIRAQTQNIAYEFTYPGPTLNGGHGWDFMQCNSLEFGDVRPVGDTRCNAGVLHPGVDLNDAQGGNNDRYDPVVATAKGLVTYAANSGNGYGNLVVIRHTLPDGSPVWSAYAHLEDFSVTTGTPVNIGQQIGRVGLSGGQAFAHLHFEIRIAEFPEAQWTTATDTPNSLYGRYVNPLEFIDNFNYYSRLQDRAFVFSGSFWRGDLLGYLLPGFHSLAGLPINNAASSVSLPSNWGMTAYEGENGSGPQKFFGQSDFNFANDGYTSNNQSFSVDNTISSVRVSYNNCSNLAVSAAVRATLSCDPNPAPQPGGNPTPAPTTQPNPSSFEGITFYREKNYNNPIRELGIGEHSFTDDFLSVRMDTSNMHFTVMDEGGGKDCFDTARLGGTQYPSFNDHGDWWHKTARIKVEYGSCPQGQAPTKWVVFFREKNYVNRFTEKSIGWEGAFTEDFLSVKLDMGVSFIAVDERNETRCFDLWDFGGKQEYPSFNDHGDWWHNIKWLRVQNNLCPPHDVQLNYPKDVELPFNTDVTLDLNIPANSNAIYGEIWGLSEAWQWHQPATNRYWHLGVFPPGGPYTVRLRAVNDNGFGNWTDFKFSVKRPPDCNDVTATGIVLFDGILCSGEEINLNVSGWYTLDQFDKRTSSIHVQPGWSVEVLEGSTTSDGKATCITETEWNLSFENYWPWNTSVEGTISTVRVFQAPNCGRTQPIIGCNDIQLDGVGIFDYASCLGEERLYTQPGFYNLTDFAKVASSIFVKKGWSVRVYSEHSRYGSYVCFTETKWDLSYDNFWFASLVANNSIVSIEVFADPLCGWPQVITPYDPEHELVDTRDFTLHWNNLYAGDYEVVLTGPNGYSLTSGKVIQPEWHLGPIPAGEYTWRVRGSMLGTTSEWSTEHRFTVVNSAETPPAVDCNEVTTGSVQLFSEAVCQGTASPVFGPGVHELDPAVNGGTLAYADLTQSLHLAPGVSVKVYQDNNRQGLASCYGETMWNLALDKYWGTQEYVGGTISSIEVFANPFCGVPQNPPPAQMTCIDYTGPGVVVFGQSNCGGTATVFSSPGYYTLSDALQQIISSLYVGAGWSAEIFSKSSPQDGMALCVTETQGDLHGIMFYDHPTDSLFGHIKALRIYNAPNCGKQHPLYGGCGLNIAATGIVLFDYKDCSGSEVAFTKPGKYELSDWHSEDSVSAISIQPGWSIKVYQDKNQAGLTSCYTTDMWNLESDTFWSSSVMVGNAISSVEVFDNPRCESVVVSTPPQALSAPKLLSPLNTALSISSTISLTWETHAQAQLFEVVVTGPTSSTVQITSTSYVIPTPQSGAYDWLVRALSTDDAVFSSEWSRGQFVVLEEAVTLPPDGSKLFLPIVNR